jgi:hypothetical protein
VVDRVRAAPRGCRRRRRGRQGGRQLLLDDDHDVELHDLVVDVHLVLAHHHHEPADHVVLVGADHDDDRAHDDDVHVHHDDLDHDDDRAADHELDALTTRSGAHRGSTTRRVAPGGSTDQPISRLAFR